MPWASKLCGRCLKTVHRSPYSVHRVKSAFDCYGIKAMNIGNVAHATLVKSVCTTARSQKSIQRSQTKPLRASSDNRNFDALQFSFLTDTFDMMLDSGLALRPEDLRRLDESDDAEFYSSARFTFHTDEAFRARLTKLYSMHLQAGARVLDLCSSWESHLPPQPPLTALVGHGMNEAELAANRRLASSFVQDLNKDCDLRSVLEDDSFDAVLCCSGIQYLTQPVPVMREIRRVLKPGGKFIVSFSNNCFPEKAVAIWLARPSMRQRAELVAALMHAAGFDAAHIDEIVDDCDKIGRNTQSAEDTPRRLSDAFSCLVARKQAKQAVAAVVETAGSSTAPSPALLEMDVLGTREENSGASSATLERWRAAYGQMSADARALGIPASAIPFLPAASTEEDIRRARDHLSAMIASFVSSGL